jgi:hypothetical protein
MVYQLIDQYEMSQTSQDLLIYELAHSNERTDTNSVLGQRLCSCWTGVER